MVRDIQIVLSLFAVLFVTGALRYLRSYMVAGPGTPSPVKVLKAYASKNITDVSAGLQPPYPPYMTHWEQAVCFCCRPAAVE